MSGLLNVQAGFSYLLCYSCSTADGIQAVHDNWTFTQLPDCSGLTIQPGYQSTPADIELDFDSGAIATGWPIDQFFDLSQTASCGLLTCDLKAQGCGSILTGTHLSLSDQTTVPTPWEPVSFSQTQNPKIYFWAITEEADGWEETFCLSCSLPYQPAVNLDNIKVTQKRDCSTALTIQPALHFKSLLHNYNNK